METFFKKYFWVLTLAALTGTAYLAAQTAVELGVDQLLPSDSSLKLQASNITGQPLYERTNAKTVGDELTDRNAFNLEYEPGGESAEKGDCQANCEDKECGSDGCGGSCGTCDKEQRCSSDGQCESADETPQESSLNIELVGTMVHPVDHNLRFANILVGGGSPQMVAVGSEIEGAGGSVSPTVMDIMSKVIYLKEKDRVTYVGLWQKSEKGSTRNRPSGPKPRIGKRPSPKSSSRSSVSSGSKYDYRKGVKKMSEFEYNIDRQMLDEQLTDLTQLGMQARVIPNYRGGKYEGFKLVGVKPGSLYRAIGIRSGDVIKAINGESINSPNKAMELFHQLKSSSEVQLEIERRRKTETFKYSIQ